MKLIDQYNNISIVSGDDFCFSISFECENGEIDLEKDETKVEFVIHEAPDDIVICADNISANCATFYLSSDLTSSLLKRGIGCSYKYCVHLYHKDIGRYTPPELFRKELRISRC